MKIFFFGSYKNGKELLRNIPTDNLLGAEIEGHEPNWQQVAKADCLWFFGSKDRFAEIFQQILLIQKPLIINLSKNDLPKSFLTQLQQKNIQCIYGPRICLGMNLLSPFINFLNKGQLLWNDSQTHIHDTAASDEPRNPGAVASEWASMISSEANVLTDRIANNPGSTKISLSTENETIEISHKVHNQNAYIQGALWASYKILFASSFDSNLVRFEELFWQSQAINLMRDSESQNKSQFEVCETSTNQSMITGLITAEA